jgi:glycosyltransferase involved in cell wall biosynthesis
VGNYLPYLQEAYSYVVTPIPKSFFERMRIYRRLPRADILFIQKKLFRPWEMALLARKAAAIVYDLDDAVIYRDREEGTEDRRVRRLSRKFQNTVCRAEIVIAGNPILAELAAPWAKRVVILPTPVDLHRYCVRPYGAGLSETVTLGWVGTRGNLKYLKDLTPVLQRLTEQYPTLRMKVVCDAPFSIPGVSVTHKPWALEEEARDLQNFDIGIMPLPDNPWTRGKCGYKILQYMAAGVPTVASPVGFNRQIIQEGVNGFLASTTEEWFLKLSLCIRDSKLREQIGMNGRKTVESEYALSASAVRFQGILNEARIEEDVANSTTK